MPEIPRASICACKQRSEIKCTSRKNSSRRFGTDVEKELAELEVGHSVPAKGTRMLAQTKEVCF